MTIAETIQTRVTETLKPELLELVNESDQNSGPPGRESHFRWVVGTPEFEGLSRVRRHQAIYGLCQDLMPQPLHALALHTFTPTEWQARGESATASPNCLGGSKHDK